MPLDAAEILTAIERLRKDVRGDIESLRETIGKMAQDQHAFQLSQSEKNATFADRSRTEEIGKQIHDEVNRGIIRDGKVQEVRLASDAATRDITQMRETLEPLAAAFPEPVRLWVTESHNRHVKRTELSDHVIRQVAGYVALVIAGAILAALGIVTVAPHFVHLSGH